jgi:hypothetical protein
MTQIAIAAETFDWHHEGWEVGDARFYFNRNFKPLGDSPVIGGKVNDEDPDEYKLITASQSGDTISLASCTLPATVDSSDPTVTGDLWIHDTDGEPRLHLYSSLRIPPTPTSTTWEALRIYTDGPDDAPTETVMDAVNAALQEFLDSMTQTAPFVTAIPFTAQYTRLETHTMTADVPFTPNTVGAEQGNETLVRLIGDGTHVVSFDGIKIWSGSAEFLATAGRLNVLIFWFDGVDYWVNIGRETTFDHTAPTFVSATIEDAHPDRVLVTYDEDLDETVTPAYTVTGGKAQTGVSISGPVATVQLDGSYSAGDSPTISGGGTVKDLSGNLAAALSAEPITNNIATPILTISELTGIVRSGNNYNTINGAPVFEAVADDFLPAGDAGAVIMDIDFSGNSIETLIALSPDYEATNYAGMPLALYLAISGTYKVTSSLIDTGVVGLDGDKIGVFRDGSNVVKAKYYRSGVWTDLCTYAGTHAGNMYCVFWPDAYPRNIVNPTGQGLVFGAAVPVLLTATVENANPDKIVLTFNRTLETGATGIPSTADWILNLSKTVTGVSVVGTTVTLTVNSAYAHGDVPIIQQYASGFTNAANRIRDAALGYRCASFHRTVTNNVI